MALDADNLDDAHRIYVRCRNKHTGTEWWSRVPREWRPHRVVEFSCLSGDELVEAKEAYAHARTTGVDPQTVHKLWSTAPDYTEPDYPLSRERPHHLQVELGAIIARLGEISAEVSSFPSVSWDQTDLWKYEDLKRTLDTAKKFTERALRATDTWSTEWPPEQAPVIVLPLPQRYIVQLRSSSPLAAFLPAGEMVATHVNVGEGDVSMVVTHDQLPGGALVPVGELDVKGVL